MQKLLVIVLCPSFFFSTTYTSRALWRMNYKCNHSHLLSFYCKPWFWNVEWFGDLEYRDKVKISFSEIKGFEHLAPCPKNQKNLKKTLLSLIFGYCHYDILLKVPGKNKNFLRARLRDILWFTWQHGLKLIKLKK